MITGGCFCGAIRYSIEPGDYPVTNCHCSMCRRTSAAAFVTWIVVPVEHFQLIKGEPTVLQSSIDGSRHLCSLCGTPVSCLNTKHPEIIDVTLCSLDDPTIMSPTFESHADSRLPWVNKLSSDISK